MLRIRIVLLFGWMVLLLGCSARGRNFVMPPQVTPTMTPLVITEAAPVGSNVDSGFVTQEPLVVEQSTDDGSRGLGLVDEEALALAAAVDDATQLLVMSEMVQLIQSNYVDETLNGVDWQAVLDDMQNNATPQSDEAFWASMADTLELLNDNDAFFMSPTAVQAYEQMIRGKEGQVGIGIVTLPRPDTRDALIVWAIDENAAHSAGVNSRDRLLAVDGQPICCDKRNNLFNLIRGSADSTVELTVQTPGEAERTVRVTRQPLMLHNPVEATRMGDIGVITIHSFVAEMIDQAVFAAWEELNASGPLAGLILDVRPNTGGFEQEMTNTLALFTDGQVGLFRNRFGSAPLIVAGQNIHDSQTVPLVVLVGEATGSQAEIFAGVLQHQARATLVGGRTQGKITSIFPHDLSDGSRVWLPEDRFELPEGGNWADRGLTPDMLIEQMWSEISDKDDDQTLAAALVLLTGR